MGCLVTDTVDFPEEPNHRPSIVTTRGAASPPLDEVLRIRLDQRPAEEGSEEQPFRVLVADSNLEQDLAYNTFINYKPDVGRPGPRGGGVLPATGELERELSFTIPIAELRPAGACYKLELLVSSDFDDLFPYRTPAIEGDAAVAVWFVEVTNSGEAIEERCPGTMGGLEP